LENNIAVSVDDSSKFVSSLTIQPLNDLARPDETNWVAKNEAAMKLRDALIDARVVVFAAPKSWETIDGLKIIYSAELESPKTGEYAEYYKKVAATLEPFIVRQIIVTRGNTQASLIDKDPLRVASRGFSKAGLPESELASRREQRLRDFSIEINVGAPLFKLDQSASLKTTEDLLKNVQFNEDNKKSDGDNHCLFTPLKNGQMELVIDKEHSPVVGQIEAEGFRLSLFTFGCDIGDMEYSVDGYLHDSRQPGQPLDFNWLTKNTTGPDNNYDNDSPCDLVQPSCEFGAELFFNRYLVIWPKRNSAAVSIFDVDKRELIAHLKGLPSPDAMQRVSLSKDLKTVVKLDTDGGMQVIALRAAQKDGEGHLTQDSTKVEVLLSGRIVDDEVVVWAPSGRFDSTAEGASHVAVRFPGRSGEYTLDQFHKLFYENDLLKRALAGKEFKPPVVKTFPPSIKATPSFASGSIAAKIDVLGDDPVDEIRIYQDGLMTNVVPVAADARTIDVAPNVCLVRAGSPFSRADRRGSLPSP
jgi:hypothetical protein